MENYKKLVYKDLGTLLYEDALKLQIELQEKVISGSDDCLLFVEHPKVITLGLNANQNNILQSEDYLLSHGYEIKKIRRGGDVTYHGPGQLVGYMIFNLKKNHGGSIKTFVHTLEEVLIDFLFDAYGIRAQRDPINAGVFVGESKIAALGLSVSKGVTMHGFALNANTNLDDFSVIVPCGLANRTVTSIEKELGKSVDMSFLKNQLLERIERSFGFEK